MMHYEENVTKIPSAAISIEAAEMLHRMYLDEQEILIYLYMEAHNYPPVESRNTIAEIEGSEMPEKVTILPFMVSKWTPYIIHLYSAHRLWSLVAIWIRGMLAKERWMVIRKVSVTFNI